MCADVSNNFTIVDITEEAMVQAVAKLHIETFPGYLNARCGLGYMTTFIEWFVCEKEAVALAAIDSQQRIIGYALGISTEDAHRRYRELQSMAARSLILRPWLLFDARLWQVAKSRFGGLVNREQASYRHDLPKPTMGLVLIGVGALYRRQRVAVHLLEAFQEKSISRKMQSLSAQVAVDNTSARRLYERCGWQPSVDSLNQKSDSLRYFKLIAG